MFKRLWRSVLSLFVCSKEERWERLDRLAATNPAKFTAECEQLTDPELRSYLKSVGEEADERIKYGYPDLREHLEYVLTDPVKGGDYHWTPGKEHADPIVKPTSRKPRAGVFERKAMSHEERRKIDAAARRERLSRKGKQ